MWSDDADKLCPCPRLSQNEFAIHFALASQDPRHPGHGSDQRRGVYGAHMFSKPGDGDESSGSIGNDMGGIHHINLDGRSHRSPTFKKSGRCEGGNSDMLGVDQWAWLEKEMDRESEVKVIGSGVQVLPPTHRGRNLSEYCSHDGKGIAFDRAIDDVAEGPNFQGTEYEGWSEIPIARRVQCMRGTVVSPLAHTHI